MYQDGHLHQKWNLTLFHVQICVLTHCLLTQWSPTPCPCCPARGLSPPVLGIHMPKLMKREEQVFRGTTVSCYFPAEKRACLHAIHSQWTHQLKALDTYLIETWRIDPLMWRGNAEVKTNSWPQSLLWYIDSHLQIGKQVPHLRYGLVHKHPACSRIDL